MANATFPLPDALQAVLTEQLGAQGLGAWGVEAMVVEAVRQGLISRGMGGEMLGLGFHEREALYARRGVVYDYTDEELDAEASDLRRMLGSR